MKPTVAEVSESLASDEGKKHHHFLKHNIVSICRKRSLSISKFQIQLLHLKATYLHSFMSAVGYTFTALTGMHIQSYLFPEMYCIQSTG